MKKLLNVLLVLSAVSAVVPAQAMSERAQRAHNRNVKKRGTEFRQELAADDAENAQGKQIALTQEESDTIDTQALICKGAIAVALIAAVLATGLVYANTTIVNCASIAHDTSAVGYEACMGLINT